MGGMAFNIDDWVARTQNKYWDVDGYYGAQCWDLWAKYCMDAYGLPMNACTTPTGYAGGLYASFPTSPQVGETFEKKGSDYNPVKGDVVIWQVCPTYKWSHIAIVLGGIDGDTIDVLTQNPEPSVHKKIPLERAHVGYLHPKNLPSGGTTPGGNNPTGTNTPTVTNGGSEWIESVHGNELWVHRVVNGQERIEVFYKSVSNVWIKNISKTNEQNNSNGGDGGQAHPSVGGEAGYALYVVGTVESGRRWDAVEGNLQGIGIAQWSFNRRKDLLKSMRKCDAAGWSAFAAAAPAVASAVESDAVFDRPLTQGEADAFATFARRDQSKQGQREQFAADYTSYPHRYDDDRMQILWVTAYHQAPASASAIPEATTLAGLRDNILATSPFGSYYTRYQTAYNLLNIWDGTSNPPNF